MYSNSEEIYDSIFLSYGKILEKFKQLDVTTKNGKEIAHKDLRYAVDVMMKKHPSCRWRSEKESSKKYYILVEGYEWILKVYFQKEKSILEADIEFFLWRINLYKEVLNIEENKIFWDKEMSVNQLAKYFRKTPRTIKKAIQRMLLSECWSYKKYLNEKVVITVSRS